MAKLLKSKIFWVAVVALALVGLYALAGFVAAPRLIRSNAIKFVRDTYGRELQIGTVRVNPFKLQVEIENLALPDRDSQVMLGFRRLFIDFEIASLWHRAYTFKDVDFDAPSVRAVIHPDGAMNLADLAPPEATAPDAHEADTTFPAVWIESLVVKDGRATYRDEARRHVFERLFSPIGFRLKHFRTTPTGGVFGLSARSQHDETFDWNGRLVLTPNVSSQGRFSIANLRAPSVAEFVGDTLPFGVSNGLINLNGTYDFNAGGGIIVKAALPSIEMKSLALRANGVDTDWIEIPSLVIADTSIAMPAQTVTISNVTLSDMKAQTWLNADGSTNMDQFFGRSAADAPPAAPPDAAASGTAAVAANPPPAAAASTNAQSAWQVNVGGVDVREASIDFEDRSQQPAVKLAVAPLNAGFQNITLDLAKPLPVKFDAKINGKATLTGSGMIAPDPRVVDIDFDLDGFDLRDVQPYVAASTDMTIKRGTIAASGKLGISPPGGSAPEMSFAGDVSITKFRSIDNALEQDFFLFDRVELTKLRYASLPDSLSIERVRVVKPFNRVIVSSDQVLNVMAVFDPAGTAATVKANQEAAAVAKAAASHKKTRTELKAEKAAKAAAAKAAAAKAAAAKAAAAKAAAAKARASAPPPPPSELKESGMPIRIRELSVENGRMDFADFSIQPNFTAYVTDLNGNVTGMSSDPKARAKVAIKGSVGEFSPVTIAGEVQPFAYDRHTDIGLKFENISLPIFNPYSGKFAGYNIAKGKLTTDLHYTIADRKLAATHKIRIDQLEWGEATAQKGEATLPVKFATSLLKDADGVITLDVPVNGTIDDPKFRVWPIVWQIIRNILTKAVTAPFRALGALFKGAEEAQFVDFAPGQATLDEATSGRLAGLAKALAPKADIRLEVPIGALPELDRAALADQRYDEELQAAMERTLRTNKMAADASLPAFDALKADQEIVVLTDMVQHLTGSPPQIPEPGERPEGVSRKEHREATELAAIDYLQAQAKAHLVPGDPEVDKLGQQRAEAVQHALLTDTGLDPQRVFLVKEGKVTPQDGKVRFELAMQ